MLTRRLIPCLDIKGGRTVKGIRFESLQDAGDPVELGAHYAAQGADELVFLDISATQEERRTFTGLVGQIARHLNIPFTVGGGIRGLEDVAPLLEAGADKISINSAAVTRPELIDELARNFGSQFIVAAIDARKIHNQWTVSTHGGTSMTERRLFSWAKECQERGAGEILFTSMDHDGTRSGFAVDALEKLNQLLNIPVIASGGAGNAGHFLEAFNIGKADAALAAGIFHFGDLSLPDLRSYLQAHHVPLRTHTPIWK